MSSWGSTAVKGRHWKQTGQEKRLNCDAGLKRPWPPWPGELDWILPLGVMPQCLWAVGEECDLGEEGLRTEADLEIADSWRRTAVSPPPIKLSLEGEARQHICVSTGQVCTFGDLENTCGLIISDSRCEGVTGGSASILNQAHSSGGMWVREEATHFSSWDISDGKLPFHSFFLWLERGFEAWAGVR